MEDERARTLLEAERARVQRLLDETLGDAGDDRDEANAGGDMADPEQRLAEGTFGVSVRSGAPIPDDRLEADPAAELTVEEAQHS